MKGIWKIKFSEKYHIIRADIPDVTTFRTFSVYFDDTLIHKMYFYGAAGLGLGEVYEFEKLGHVFSIQTVGRRTRRFKLYIDGKDADKVKELPVSLNLTSVDGPSLPSEQSEHIVEQEWTDGDMEAHNISLEGKVVNVTKRALQVFLCHSSSDKPAVEKYYKRLKKNGIAAWLDKKNLLPGQNWQIEIPKAVRNSDVVIVFLSSHSVTKEGYVQKEIRIALDTADEKPDGTIFIIPAKLENCEVPERLAGIQWVNLFEKSGYHALVKALQIRAAGLGITMNLNTNNLKKQRT